MDIETVHLHRSTQSRNYQILFLIIPIVIFGLVLTYWLLQIHRFENLQVATTQEPTVLGEQGVEVDNLPQELQNK